MKKTYNSILVQDQRTLEAWHILWCDVETSNVFQRKRYNVDTNFKRFGHDLKCGQVTFVHDQEQKYLQT